MRVLLSILSLFMLYSCVFGDVSDMKKLKKEFADPGVEYRALPMDFEYKEPEKFGDWMVEGGWGGAHFNYPYGGPGYLNDQKGWDAFSAAVDACRKRGLKVWIYDEMGYPSGRAGGLTLKDHPEYEAQGLFYDSTDVSLEKAAPFEWRVPAGQPYYVAVYKLDWVGTLAGEPMDVTQRVKDGVLKLDLEPGDWRIMAFVQNRLFDGTHASLTGGPYLNILNPDAVKRFIEITYDAYYQHYAEDFGKTITAAFNDESSVMSGYLKKGTQAYPAIAWYHGLPEIFEKRNGYDIKQALPSLFNQVGPRTVRNRCDFYSTIADTTAQNYFGQIQKWCKERKIAFTGHLVWEESLIYHTNFYGSVFPSLSNLDWPGIDVLGCNYGCTSGAHTEGGPVTPKLISSAAHLYNKPRTMSESFCFVTNKTPVEDLMSHVAWQWTMGINSLTTLSIHKQYESDAFRKLNDYTGRMSYMLTQGRFTADVAVLYPIASVWADFVPTNRHVSYINDNPRAKDVDDAWQQATRTVLGCQRDFDYIDESIIEKAIIAGGTLTSGQNRYPILVLPHVTTLRYSTLKQIDKFVRSGGIVISFETIPSIREDDGPADEFGRLVERLWGVEHREKGRVAHVETTAALEKALIACGNPDVLVSPRTPEVYYQHRALDNGDIYFLLNNSDQPLSGKFSFRATGKVEIWDPVNGKTKPVSASTKGKMTMLDLTLPRRNGLFVVFSSK